MSERFVCVLTWRYISIVYTLSLCCPAWQIASLYLSLRFVSGLIKMLFVCLYRMIVIILSTLHWIQPPQVTTENDQRIKNRFFLWQQYDKQPLYCYTVYCYIVLASTSAAALHTYLNHVRNGIKQFNQSGNSIVGNTTLATEVAVVCWYKPVEQ